MRCRPRCSLWHLPSACNPATSTHPPTYRLHFGDTYSMRYIACKPCITHARATVSKPQHNSQSSDQTSWRDNFISSPLFHRVTPLPCTRTRCARSIAAPVQNGGTGWGPGGRSDAALIPKTTEPRLVNPQEKKTPRQTAHAQQYSALAGRKRSGAHTNFARDRGP